MNKEEIKIITLGDIFKNIETEEKVFKFLNYIKELQAENQQLKKKIDDVVEYIKKENEWVKNRDYKLLKTDVLLRMLGEIDEL